MDRMRRNCGVEEKWRADTGMWDEKDPALIGSMQLEGIKLVNLSKCRI